MTRKMAPAPTARNRVVTSGRKVGPLLRPVRTGHWYPDVDDLPFYAPRASQAAAAVPWDRLDTTILWTDAFAVCNYLGLADAQ